MHTCVMSGVCYEEFEESPTLPVLNMRAFGTNGRSIGRRIFQTTSPASSFPIFCFSSSHPLSSSSCLHIGRLRRIMLQTLILDKVPQRSFATESKHSVAIPPAPPHKYKAYGDAFRICSALLGVVIVGYIATRERTDEPHWTTQVRDLPIFL